MPSTPPRKTRKKRYQITRHVVTALSDVARAWEALLAVLMVVLINRDKPQGGKRAPFIRLWIDAATRELVGYIHLNSTTGGLRTKLLAAGIRLTGVRAGEDRNIAGPLEGTGLTDKNHTVPAMDLRDQARADLAIKIAGAMPTIKSTLKTFLREWRAEGGGDPTDQDYADYLLARVESCRGYEYAQGTYYEINEPCKRPGNPDDDALPFAAAATPPLAPLDPAAAFQDLFGVLPGGWAL